MDDQAYAQRVAAEAAARARVVKADDRLLRLMEAWYTHDDPSEVSDLFDAEWEAGWAEHKDATLQRAALEGNSPRRAELFWRQWRAQFSPVDPSVALTAHEVTELGELDAQARAAAEALRAELERRIESRRKLRPVVKE